MSDTPLLYVLCHDQHAYKPISSTFALADLTYRRPIHTLLESTCSQRLYLLAQLKKQGLGIFAIDSVFKTIVHS